MSTVEKQVDDDFGRLTLSPTIRRYQLCLHPIRTRRLPEAAGRLNVHGFVDDSCMVPTHSLPTLDARVICRNGEPEDGSNAASDDRRHTPLIITSSFKKAQEEVLLSSPEVIAAQGTGRCAFADRFGDLPMAIRWRLLDACRAEMQELLEEVEKEMGSARSETTLPEDIGMWRDVIAAALVVGLDVEKAKQKLYMRSCR